MAFKSEISVVDLAACGAGDINAQGTDRQVLMTVANKICESLKDIGCLFIRNHGIPQSQIDDFNSVSMNFFAKPIEYKQGFARPYSSDQCPGYIGPGAEVLDKDNPGDLKEGHYFFPTEDSKTLPSIPRFEATRKEFFASCRDLTLRIFDLIDIGLQKEDRHFFRKCHEHLGGEGNSTALESVFYPPVSQLKDTTVNQLRCAEHSDFGSITLLFLDNNGGLEVCNHAGKYIPVTLVPGAVLILIGNIMQRWTADDLIAIKHRVIIPEDEAKRRQSRQTIAFFVMPDDNVTIECLDGSQKYKPVTLTDYLMKKVSNTYIKP